MTKEEVRAWKERWRLVNEYEIAETRAMTVEERLDALDAVYRMGTALFAGREVRAPSKRDSCQHWARLRQLAAARPV